MNLAYYFQQLYNFLNDPNSQIILMTVYLCLAALALFLRTVSCMTYRSVLFAFRLDAKDIKTRDEISKIRNGLLRKIAADYIRIADKSVSRIPSSAVVQKHVSALSLLGWRLVSVMPFVEALETGLLWVGLILAVVFTEYTMMYGTLAAARFVLFRVFTAFFDFRTAKNLLFDELLIYTEREIGHFYAADAGGAVLRLKNELSDAIARQSDLLKAAIGQISDALAEAIGKKLTDMNDKTQHAAQAWEKALSAAGHVQSQINAAAAQMQTASVNIMSSSDLLARHLQGHSNALSEQLLTLVRAVDALKEGNAAFAAEQEGFLRQAQYIERNQAVLETTLQAFEETLKNMTRSLGDGLGTSLKHHSQAAAQTVNDTLTRNMERILTGNQETLTRLQTLFDQLRDQSQDISAHLRSMHEKLEVRSDG